MAEAYYQFRLKLLNNWVMVGTMTLYLRPVMQERELRQTLLDVLLQIINTVILMFTTAAASLAGVVLFFLYLFVVYILAAGVTSTETLRRLNAVAFKFIFIGVLMLSFTGASFALCIVQCFAKLACRVVNAWQFMQDEEPEAGDVANANAEAENIANAEVEDIADAEAQEIANAEAQDIANAEAQDIANAEVQDIANAEVEDITNAEVQDIANAEAQDIANAEAQEIANAEAQDIANAEAQDIANAEAQDIANAEVEDITNAEAQDETKDVLVEVGDVIDHVDPGDVAAGGSGTEEASENFRDAIFPIEIPSNLSTSFDPFSQIDLPVPRISQSLLPRVPRLSRRYRRHNSSRF